MSIQGTDEWKQERLGKATASRIADIIAKTKSGWGASRYNYASQLIVERLTKLPGATFVNQSMQWGTDTEPLARKNYSMLIGVEIEETGFITHPRLSESGASPDGLIGSDGLIEIKCPNTANHIETILGEPIEKKYIMQMQWQMSCLNRTWCDFVSFDPRLPYELQMKVIRINRDDIMLDELEKEIEVFLREIDEKVNALKKIIANET